MKSVRSAGTLGQGSLEDIFHRESNEGGGVGGVVIGTILDVFDPEVSWEKKGVNLAFGVLGVVGGWEGAAVAGLYFAVDTFYDGDGGRGWEGFATDIGNLHY